MGLFSNNKKLCPICGNATPRLLPRKFDDQPICKECENKIDLPADRLKTMTLAGFREYLAVYEENQPLRAAFHATYSHSLFLDEGNGLIRLCNNDRSWAIEKAQLKSFRILEDENVLYESGNGVLNSYQSDVPARAEALRSVVASFQLEKQEYERRERMEALRHRNETDEQRRERERIERQYRPKFEDPKLFWGFRIEVTFDHPYWDFYTDKEQGPVFDDDYPDVDEYLKKYERQTEQLHTLAVKLMQLINPNAGEKGIGSGTQSAGVTAAPASDIAAELKKYKELQEQGILTEEEFTEKKRQLLGI